MLTWYKIKEWYRWLFNPPHRLIVKSIPRHWMDLDHLAVDIIFAVIKQFEVELKANEVDLFEQDVPTDEWSAGHVEEYNGFKTWFLSALHYINIDRVAIEKQREEILSKADLTISLKQATKTHFLSAHELEELMYAEDTRVCKEMFDHRRFFWT